MSDPTVMIGVVVSIASLVVTVLMGTIALRLILRYLARHRESDREAQFAEHGFEKAMQRQFDGAGESLDVPLPTSPADAGLAAPEPPRPPIEKPVAETVRPSRDDVGPVGGVDAAGDPPGKSIKDVLRQLEGLGQVDGTDGTVMMEDGRGKGLAFRFTNGKRGLILPVPATPEAEIRYLRGYDYVFTIVEGDNVAVSRRFQDFVADLIDPGGFG